MDAALLSPFRPAGDPGAIKQLAAEVFRLSQNAQGMDSALASCVSHAAFEGPGRTELDAAIRTGALRAGRGASELRKVAQRLADAATQLERAQKQWDHAQAKRLSKISGHEGGKP